MKNQKLKSILANDPELMALVQQKELADSLKAIAMRPVLDLAREIMKGDKGDKGEDGYTPVKGKDYFDGESIRGEDGEDGYTPVKGVDYFTNAEISHFVNRVAAIIPNLDTVKLSQDVHDRLLHNKAHFFEPAPDIIAKVNTQKNSIEPSVIKGYMTLEEMVKEIKDKKLLKTKDIGGMSLNMNDQRWHGGGLSSVSHDATLTGNGTPSSPLSVVGGGTVTWSKETPVGLINGINTTYTILHIPTANSMNLIVNGQVYTEGVDYSLAGTTITMTVPLDAAFASLPFISQYTYS